MLVIGGGVGLLAAAVLLLEKIALLADPSYVPSCSINPVLNCGSVMNTAQAEAFGFPNPILGVAGFTAVITVGAVLLAGARLPRAFWLLVQAGVTFGVLFVHWLMFQSLYRIGALCPYCLAVWVAMITLFVSTTAHTIRAGHLPAPTTLRRLAAYGPVIITGWLTVIAALIAVQFWDYWATLAP